MAEQKPDNTALEEAIAVFREDKERDSYVKVMEILEKSIVIVPTMPLENIPEEVTEQLREGKVVAFPKETKVLPCLLKKETGEQALPIFTSVAQIPPEKMSPSVVAMPFMSCVAMYMANQDKVAEIVVNPFSELMILTRSILEVADKRRKAATEIKTVQLTREQFQNFAHNRVALYLLPKYLFTNGLQGLEEFQREEGALMMRFYEQVYPKETGCGFRAEDFSLMILNLTDNIQLTRLDMPDAVNKKGMCYRVYAAFKRDMEEVSYYALEYTKDGKFIAKVTKDGKHEIVEPAPDNGAEIEAIMNLL